jgi:hypothetical protein
MAPPQTGPPPPLHAATKAFKSRRTPSFQSFLPASLFPWLGHAQHCSSPHFASCPAWPPKRHRDPQNWSRRRRHYRFQGELHLPISLTFDSAAYLMPLYSLSCRTRHLRRGPLESSPSSVASWETRSSPPRPGNYGETTGQGGGSGSSPERHNAGEGGGGGSGSSPVSMDRPWAMLASGPSRPH